MSSWKQLQLKNFILTKVTTSCMVKIMANCYVRNHLALLFYAKSTKCGHWLQVMVLTKNYHSLQLWTKCLHFQNINGIFLLY